MWMNGTDGKTGWSWVPECLLATVTHTVTLSVPHIKLAITSSVLSSGPESWSRWPLHQLPWTVYSRVKWMTHPGTPVCISVLQLVKESRTQDGGASPTPHRLWCRWWKAPKDGISLGCWTEHSSFFLTFLLFSIPVLLCMAIISAPCIWPPPPPPLLVSFLSSFLGKQNPTSLPS
jgi:hypothetical protein